MLGMANLNNPSYTIERWHCVLVTYLIAICAALANIYLSRFLNQISTFAVIWNILSFFVVIITILATQDNKQSASFVFSDFQNDTGFASSGMAVMIGLLQTLFGKWIGTRSPTHPSKRGILTLFPRLLKECVVTTRRAT